MTTQPSARPLADAPTRLQLRALHDARSDRFVFDWNGVVLYLFEGEIAETLNECLDLYGFIDSHQWTFDIRPETRVAFAIAVRLTNGWTCAINHNNWRLDVGPPMFRRSAVTVEEDFRAMFDRAAAGDWLNYDNWRAVLDELAA